MKRDLRRTSFEYFVAVAAVLAVAGIRAALTPVLGDAAPLILFLLPVIVVAWLGGFGPGLVATVLGGGLGIWMFAPVGTLAHPTMTTGDYLKRAIPFLVVGGTISLLAATLERLRRRATESGLALAHAERLQRQIFDSANEFAIFTTDPAGLITTWSTGAERLFGFARAEAVGMPAAVLFTPEDLAAGVPQVEMGTARAQGRASDERWHLRKDGGRFFASGVVTPLCDAAGGVVGFTKVARDATEQHETRQALEDARRRIRTALVAGEVGTYEWDVTADFVHGDENFARIFGVPRALDGRTSVADYVQVIHPDEAGRVRAAIEHSVATGEDFEQEFRVVADGPERRVLSRGRMETDALGRVVRFAGVVIDVTDKYAAAVRSRQQEERYRTLFNSVDDGFCIIEVLFDAAGRPVDYLFLDVNPTFQRQSGLTDVIGRRIKELVPEHEQYWSDLYGHVAMTGEMMRFSNEAKALGRWFEVSAFRLDGPESRQVAVLFTDVTGRVQADRERDALLAREQQLRVTAEQASRMKDDFLATISHELRTPLTSIVGWTHLLRDDPGDPAMLAEGIDVIARNAEAQSKLIEDILDVSRITSGKLRLNMGQVDVRPVIAAAVDTVAQAARARGIDLRVELADAPALVAGDPDRLQQVFWNLLANAIKFTDRGGTVTVGQTVERSRLVTAVADTGRGIEAEFLPHLFERFRQADMSSTRYHGGLGLGLSIVRHLIESHGGTVTAASDGPGRGSVFRVELPLVSVRQETADAAVPSSAGGGPTPCDPALVGARVLVLDDEPDARRMVQATLVRCGADVTLVGTAAEALSLLPDGHGFHAVLSDVGMPGEDGHAFARKLRATERRRGTRPVPAAALTAYTQPSDRTAALDAGFDLYLAKPVKPIELIDAVTKMIETSRGATTDRVAGGVP